MIDGAHEKPEDFAESITLWYVIYWPIDLSKAEENWAGDVPNRRPITASVPRVPISHRTNCCFRYGVIPKIRIAVQYRSVSPPSPSIAKGLVKNVIAQFVSPGLFVIIPALTTAEVSR